MRYFILFTIVSSFTYLPQAQATLQFAETNYYINENDTTLMITVKRTDDTSVKMGANYATKSGSAQAGRDFKMANGWLIWTVGNNNSKTFAITINDDAVMESHEVFTVTLRNQSRILDTANVTIVDNDFITPPSRVSTPFSTTGCSSDIVIDKKCDN